MSKTLGSIALLAGTVALAAVATPFISGAIVGLGGGTFGALGVASVLAPALGIGAGFLATFTALSVAGFGPKSPRPEQTVSALRTEIPPRVSGYGRYRTFGAQALYETASDGTAVDVFAFHDGRIDAIEAYYLGDDPVTLTAGGFVMPGDDGRYGESDTIQVKVNLGAATETAWPEVIAALPGIWTENHRGDGVATGFMISKSVKAGDYQEVYPTGGPNQTPPAIVLRAQPVFDWRDPDQSLTDPLTWKWSENAVLHLAHYQLVRNGKTWARHFAPTLAYWTAAADDADIAMPLKAGGTEPRYRSCVSHKHTDEHKAVIGSLLACFDGWMAPRQDGALIVYSGRYVAPDPDDLIGPDEIVSYSWDAGIEDEAALNEIPVSYVSSAHDFNTVDADAWLDEADITSRGKVRSDPLVNQVPSHAQARRLAKRKMAQAMAPFRGTVTTTGEGSKIIGKRYIPLRIVEAEGTPHEFTPFEGPVEITQLTRNLQTGGVTFSWIAADPNIDAWNPATEEGEPAPVGDRVAREPLIAPTLLSATAVFSDVGSSEGTETEDGTIITGARILITASGPDRTDLSWYGRWRVGSSGSWSEKEYPDADPGAGVSFLTDFVPYGASLQAEVAYSVGDGRVSPWSAPTTVSTTP